MISTNVSHVYSFLLKEEAASQRDLDSTWPCSEQVVDQDLNSSPDEVSPSSSMFGGSLSHSASQACVDNVYRYVNVSKVRRESRKKMAELYLQTGDSCLYLRWQQMPYHLMRQW